MTTTNIKHRLGAFAAAALVASCVAVPSAFAQTYYDGTLDTNDAAAIPAAAATADSTRPTAAATRAAMPAPEILGLQGVEESGQLISLQQVGSYYQPIYSWYTPKYMLFTSDYSAQPSPYLVNFATHLGTMAAYNPSRAGGGAGPNAILGKANADATDDAVWALNPDVIIGDGGKSESELDSWYSGYDHTDYVKYDTSNYSKIIETVEGIRDAANNSAVTTTANNYISFINNNHNVINQTVTVALVSDYDADTGMYTVVSSYASNGTATTNRYLEAALWAGAKNLNTNTSADAITVTASELNSANVILLGGQSSSAEIFWRVTGALLQDKMLNKAYFMYENDMSYGSAYGLCMNSIENVQNLARILQPITGLSQRDALAGYYENYYHINSANLAHVMHQAFDGKVRNWNDTIVYSDYYDEDDGEWNVAGAVADLMAWDETNDCGYTPSA